MLSWDPDFVKNVRGRRVYLDPPTKAVMLCVDAKTQIHGLDRIEPVLLLASGFRPARHATTPAMNHEYSPQLNVLHGTVLARCAPRKRHAESLAFLHQLARVLYTRGLSDSRQPMGGARTPLSKPDSSSVPAGTPAGVVVRMIVLKHLCRWGFDDLDQEVCVN